MRSADHAAYWSKSSVARLSVRDGKYVGIEPENFTTVNVRQTAPSCCYIPRDGNCRWYFASEGDILTFNRRLYQDLKEHISVKYIKDLMENIRMICNIKIHLQKTRKKGNVMRSLRNMV